MKTLLILSLFILLMGCGKQTEKDTEKPYKAPGDATGYAESDNFPSGRGNMGMGRCVGGDSLIVTAIGFRPGQVLLKDSMYGVSCYSCPGRELKNYSNKD